MFYVLLLALSLTSNAYAQKKTWIELATISSVQQAIKTRKPHKVIKHLVKHGETTTEDLKKAVKLDRPDIAHLLLSNGILPDEETILYCTEQCQNLHSKNRAKWWHLHQWLYSIKDAPKKLGRWQVLSALIPN